MSGSEWSGVKPHPSWRFPGAVAKWLDANISLIEAIALLRRAGSQPEAVEALLMLHPLVILRISWELWPELGFDPDGDPEEVLARELPDELIDLCRFALWGELPPEDRQALRLVR